MSLLDTIAQKIGAKYLRKLLEGKKEYLALAAGAAIILANQLGVPVATDLDISDTNAVVGLVVSAVVAARRASISRG